ncbi:hypothetical protein G6O69_34355 [Pseudenhygromyxa sp. WMMC2535]|uniref:hypothetical protein n=1 Tax=Pseudenhygromyxa sp. WMMC2535 TaxID=2712867 RepID=UPI001554CC47|nr:hypothetical protein [Pseudenhygromyxa sp. WMMC2535]NVB42955.1 hypothetical protein [Pseudenhygromyxa sp. WMMC2535]
MVSTATTQLGADARRRLIWGIALLGLGVLAPAMAGVVACSASGASASQPAAAIPAVGELPEGPPAPVDGLPMPSLDLDWQPPIAVAGDLEGLREALTRYPRVGLGVAPDLARAGELDAAQVSAAIARLAPGTALRSLVGRGGAGVALDEVVLEDPPLVASLGEDGRTRWQLPEDLDLDEERLASWAESGDPAVLLLGPVAVDSASWRELAVGAVGSCEPALAGLLDGQARSLELIEPFLDHADAVLGAIYLRELAPVVAELDGALSGYQTPRGREAFASDEAWARQQCGERYHAYLEGFAGCVAGGDPQACPTAPRMFLTGAARIGSVEPGGYIPDDCPAKFGRDVVEDLRGPARVAAELGGEQLDARWMILAERLATLTEVYGALDELCTPARRRFSPGDLETLRTEVAALGELYRREEAPAYDARFLANDGSFRVPGLGMVRQLARYDAGTGSAARALSVGARQLRRFGDERARCEPAVGAPPVMALLVDTSTAEARLLSFFYAEELWCGTLGALER